MNKFGSLTPAQTGLSVLILCLGFGSLITSAQNRFALTEYETFHQVLLPLKNEALPQRDFRRIRSKANELVRLGKAIVKVGVPAGDPETRKELAKALQKFDKMLARLRARARSGTDQQLKASFLVVDESFEEISRLLVELTPRGIPPVITLNCPSGVQEEGSQITLTATGPDSTELLFTWSVSAGRILTGQDTPTITIETTGQGGKTISVTAVVNDGSGFIVHANCKLQIAPTNLKPNPSSSH